MLKKPGSSTEFLHPKGKKERESFADKNFRAPTPKIVMAPIFHAGKSIVRSPHRDFYQAFLLGCLASLSFDFCFCFWALCFWPFSLSFLPPLSPIAYLLFPLSLVFPPRGCRCTVRSAFTYCHEHSCWPTREFTHVG